MLDWYILIDRIPHKRPMLEAARWNAENDLAAIVKQQTFGHEGIGETFVSTVFLSLDHSHFGGPPMLFETMIFPTDQWDGYLTRCSTWAEAQAMHATAVEHVKNAFAELAKASGA